MLYITHVQFHREGDMIKDTQQKPERELLPKYKRARSYILEKVTSGQWTEANPLPSEISLAKELGVARNTVRQALDELVAENIIRKIHGKGTFLNNTKAHQSRINAFGIIVPELHRTIYPCLLKGFDEGASQTYHKTIISHTDYNLGKQADIILQMICSKIYGVAIVPSISSETPSHHIEALQQNNIPVVCCIRDVPGVLAPLVSWDFEQVGILAGHEFTKRGHKNIAYYACYKYKSTRSQEKGLRKALQENDLILHDELIHYGTKLGELQEKVKEEALVKMLNSKNKPTAVFCNDDTEAELIYMISQKIKVKVPEELSILGAGVARREGYMKKCLSSITIDTLELGKKAAILLQEMNSGQRPITQSCKILMPPKIWSGQTMAKRF